jgi:hypothetical protein
VRAFSVWAEFTATMSEVENNREACNWIARTAGLQSQLIDEQHHDYESQQHEELQFWVLQRASCRWHINSFGVVAKGGWLLEREEHRAVGTLTYLV